MLLLLEEVAQVKQGSVVLGVDGQSSSVVAFRLLRALSQRAQVVHGAGVLRVQPEQTTGQEERLFFTTTCVKSQ